MKHAMIRLAALALAISMAAGLVACGGTASSGSTSTSAASDSSSTSAASQVEIDFSKNLTEDGKWVDVNLTDYVTLPDYKNITIPHRRDHPHRGGPGEPASGLCGAVRTATEITDLCR